MSLRIGKKDPENTDLALPGNASPTHAVPHIDEEDSKTKVIIPSASGHTKFFPKSPSIPPAHALQNLGAAILKAKNFKSVTDCLSLEEDAPPLREKLGLSFQAVKILVVREKDKLNHEMSGKSEISSAVQVLFNPVEQPFKGKEMFVLQSSLLGSIHGAPPGSFLAKVSEITGSFKSLHKMALFWRSVVSELKRLWSMDKPIPHMPLDEAPDLDCCLLHQQLQLINCCITRKLRRTSTSELLDLNVGMIQDNNEVGSLERITRNLIFVKDKSGAHVPRVGASAPSKNLTMIETGEQIYSPYVQEGPVFTEELIKENEEFIMRTGSIGPGCSQLLSDMQAFKAANPGCILGDFIRWYSPPDWEDSTGDDSCESEDVSSRGGRLSGRMQREGNLWRELWHTAQPVPAAKQAPLFDEDLAVESILSSMESISPSDLLEQLFLSMLSSGFAIAESILGRNVNSPKLFYDCKEYVTVKCQRGLPIDCIDDLCKVYETVGKMVIQPEAEWLHEDKRLGEPRSGMKKLHLHVMRKDRLAQSNLEVEEHKDEKNTHMFSNLFDVKASLFRRKQSSDQHEGG
ncbi:rab3 GTPase-activating protein catalytic subunit isoform X2 [Wolffia australiana]